MKARLQALWSTRWIRWSIKTIGAIAILMLIVASIATYYIHAHQKELISKLKTSLEQKTGGEVSIDNINVGFWKTFPRLNVGINDIAVRDSVYHLPLLKMGEIYASINLFKLLFGHISIHKLHIKQGNVLIFTDRNGYSNNYLLSSKKDTTTDTTKDKKTSAPNINIGEFVFQNIQFSLIDKQHNKDIEVTINNIRAQLEDIAGIYAIKMHQDCTIGGLGFKLSNGSFLRNKRLIANWKNMHFNPKTSDLTFDETPVTLGTQVYNIGGGFNFSSDSATSKMDLKVNARNTTYADASSLISQNVQQKLKMAKWLGPIDIVATLSGSLKQSTPRIQVQVKAVNTQLTVPGDVQLDSATFIGAYLNQVDPHLLPDDPNSEILLNNMTAQWNGVPLVGKKIRVNDLIHPKLQLQMVSDGNLANLDDKFALQTIKLLQGQAHLELNFNGEILSTKSVIENISGRIDLNNGMVRYNPKGFIFKNIGGSILFNGNTIVVQNLRCALNSSNLVINVTGQNLGSVALSNKGIAKVECNVQAGKLNISDFLAVFSDVGTTPNNSKGKSSTSTPSSKVQLAGQTLDLDNILQKGALFLNFTANSVVFRNLEAHNLKGHFVFRPTQWEMNKVSFQQDAGTFLLTSVVNPHTLVNDAKVDIDMRNVNVPKVMYAFDNFGINGLSYKNLRGTMNLNGKLRTKIKNDGSLVPRSTVGYINLNLRNGALVNFQPLMDVQKFMIKKRDLSNIEFAPITNRFDIRNGNIFIHRMEIASSALRLFMEGIYSPTGNTDIAIQAPFSDILSSKNAEESLQKEGTDKKVGASLWLRATSKDGGPVKIGLDLFKGFRKDKMEERFKAEFGDSETL